MEAAGAFGICSRRSRESRASGAVCLRWRADCDGRCNAPAVAPRRDWAAGSASSTVSARLPRFTVRLSTGRLRWRRRVQSAFAVDGHERVVPAVPCACDGVPTAMVAATRPPSRRDVTGRQQARRARSRHACHALQCVRQREGNGRGGGCTRLAVDGHGRAVPAVPCACDGVPTATLGATHTPSRRDVTGRQQAR